MVVTRPLAPVIKELEDKIKNTPGWTKRFEDAVKEAHDSGIIANHYHNKPVPPQDQ